MKFPNTCNTSNNSPRTLTSHTAALHSPVVCNEHSGKNYIFVFAGRWKFLRVQFAYLFANLRVNGGVIDEVHYLMFSYDRDTEKKLSNLAHVVKIVTGQDIVILVYGADYVGAHPKSPFDGAFSASYIKYMLDVIENPCNKHFKLDDDVVYIHPGTFESLINREDDVCTIRFANIAGANWRISYIHQTMGIYNDSDFNPTGTKFPYDGRGVFGDWTNRLAELTLRAFLSLYNRKQLHRFIFNGTYLMADKHRFTINLFMIDRDAINMKALYQTLPIVPNDEYWWTLMYVQKTNPHCIVGGALVVHFSHSQNLNAMLNLKLLEEFEKVAYNELNARIPAEIWKFLGL